VLHRIEICVAATYSRRPAHKQMLFVLLYPQNFRTTFAKKYSAQTLPDSSAKHAIRQHKKR
jgi:hypothetical protein